jgi:hypothetical protein
VPATRHHHSRRSNSHDHRRRKSSSRKGHHRQPRRPTRATRAPARGTTRRRSGHKGTEPTPIGGSRRGHLASLPAPAPNGRRSREPRLPGAECRSAAARPSRGRHARPSHHRHCTQGPKAADPDTQHADPASPWVEPGAARRNRHRRQGSDWHQNEEGKGLKPRRRHPRDRARSLRPLRRRRGAGTAQGPPESPRGGDTGDEAIFFY